MTASLAQNPSEPAENSITVSELMIRMAGELSDLAQSASSVQSALGNTMDQVADLCDMPMDEFQALDRMQQVLEDLNTLTLLLADRSFNAPDLTVGSDELFAALRLASLASRLIKSSADDAEEEEVDSGTLMLF